MALTAKERADKHRETMRQRGRAESAAASEVGTIPPVADPARREFCKRSLFNFLTEYFPHSTGLYPFSDDHRRVIDRLEQCILYGGKFINAVYRGFAKTTIAENATLWATLNGHKRFVPIFGATGPLADKILESIKLELETNDLLLEDFPEVVLPIRHLDRTPQRARGQTVGGEKTFIEFSAGAIVLPTLSIPGNWIQGLEGGPLVKSPSSGAVITAYGLTAAARGLKHKTPDGENLRPDFALIDDPQTDESARSPGQTQERLKIINKGILKAAGHFNELSAIVNATVIEEDDLVERLIKSSGWQSERIKMVRRFADRHDDLWLSEYASRRLTYDRENPADQQRARETANAYYLANREEMDRGAVVSWVDCYYRDSEYSAIQHAYNALIDEPSSFASEYQQEPVKIAAELPSIGPNDCRKNSITIERGLVPAECHTLTAFIDVQQDILFWAAIAWGEWFRGHVVSYGAWPDPRRPYYTLHDIARTLRSEHRVATIEEGITTGLQALCAELSKGFEREGGQVITPAFLLVDSGYKTETVQAALRGTGAIASKGAPVGAKSRPISEYKTQPGDRKGDHWLLQRAKAGGRRLVLIDTNFWKDQVVESLIKGPGAEGVLTLHESGDSHRMLTDHLRAEYPQRVTASWGGMSRTVTEYSLKPGGPDNHWFDCFVGCYAGASMAGMMRRTKTGPTLPKKKRTQREKVSYL